MKFHSNPFVFLIPALCMGVLFGDLVPGMELIGMFGLLLALIPVALLKKYRQSYALHSFALAVFFLGAALMGQTRNLSGTLMPGEIPRIATVVDTDVSKDNWKKVILQIQHEKPGNRWISKSERVLIYSQHQFRKGDVIFFDSNLEFIRNSGNPGEFDARQYWRSKNIVMMGFLDESEFLLMDYNESGWISAFFLKFRNNLSSSIDAFIPREEASVAKALLLGDKSELSRETREAFSSAGAMHVLAISGLHVGIIMYLLFFILKQFSRWISRRKAAVISLVFIWIFVGVTGGSPSVVRAALMFSVILLGQQSGRVGTNLNTLFFSAFVLLVYDPLLLFDIGFQLSYCAMLGIFLFYDRIRGLLSVNWGWVNKAWEGTVLGISAQIFTIPLVLYHFHQFPNYFWLTNLGIMLMAGLILGVGLLFFVFKMVPWFKWVIATVLAWSLFALLWFVHWVESLPAAVARGFNPGIAEILLFYVAIIILVWHSDKKWLKWLSMLTIVIIVAGWQWNRSVQFQNREVVIFNSNKPVLAIKSDGYIYGFYSGDNRDKCLRNLESYRNVATGELRIRQMKNGRTILHGREGDFILTKTDQFIRIEKGAKSWILRLGYGSVDYGQSKIIDMPYMPDLKGHYNLKNGALVVSL